MRFSLLLPLLVLAGCAAGGPRSGPATLGVLRGETYALTAPDRVRTLLVILPGDERDPGREDAGSFARAAIALIPDSAAVTLVRPGYSDAAGQPSPGERGNGTGDNYTPDRLMLIGDAIAAAQLRYPNARTILVGDAGGAAIVANLAALRPALSDGIVLISCPCTLPEWRAHMERMAPAEPWEAPVRSLDPLQTAGGLRPTIKAAMVVGAEDRLVPPALSRAYAEALALRGIATDYRVLPGKGHDLLNDPETLAATQRMAASLPRKR